MSKLFESASIGGLTLKNRVVRSATFEGMANIDGSCTARLIDLMAELARGGVGLIISSHAYVNQQGQRGPRQLGVYRDGLIPGLARMTEAVHKEGGKIVLQLAHAGCYANVALTGKEALGPSAMETSAAGLCREMTTEEILQAIGDFKKAAVRAEKSGFDGVQIHAAHGYLLSQFLSPVYNHRTDEYGGSIENRARIVLAVLRELKSVAAGEFAVLIKMNSDDYVEGGFTRTEMVQVAAMLEKEGIDAIELSGGTHLSPEEYSFSRVTGVVSEDREVYYREAAKLYKDSISVPLMLVGGIRSYTVAERLLEDGLADFISLCRPLIREPHLVRRWQSGDTSRARCISCNQCFKPARAGKGVYCVTEELLRRKRARQLAAP